MIAQEEFNKEILLMLGTILEPETTFIEQEERKQLRKMFVTLKKDRNIPLTDKEKVWDKNV